MLPSACAAVTVLAVGLLCTSDGRARLLSGLLLLGAFVGAIFSAHGPRLAAVAPAIGLALAILVLIGLALAAFHALRTIPVALAIGDVSVAAAWAGRHRLAAMVMRPRRRAKWPNPLVASGLALFAAAVAFAVHYSAVSATADVGHSSDVAVWAYPAGARLQVGAQQPLGRSPTTLQIIVTHAGLSAAAWSHVRLIPGHSWEAPPLTLAGNGPTRVVARRGTDVVATLTIPETK